MRLVRGARDQLTGRRRCPYCGRPVPPERGRAHWCSEACVERYQIAKGDQGAARRFLWRRDRGVCQQCRTDTVAELGHGSFDTPTAGAWEADHLTPIVEGGALAEWNLRTLCIPCHRRVTAELAARRAARRRAAKDGGVATTDAGPPATTTA